MNERKGLNEIYHMASEMLPDANNHKENECIVSVGDGTGKIVHVRFKKQDKDKPFGWQPISSDY